MDSLADEFSYVSSRLQATERSQAFFADAGDYLFQLESILDDLDSEDIRYMYGGLVIAMRELRSLLSQQPEEDKDRLRQTILIQALELWISHRIEELNEILRGVGNA